ncbi:MAG TPA: hypothetical protein VLW55_01855 [Burkholderiaceae bacterium]|nr:hypothetical protein [Burkholderiaceae bacterium]
MPWSMVELNDAAVARMQAFRLQSQFQALFATAYAPREAALFGRTSRDRHQYYFSPRAAEIFSPYLAAWSSKDCSAPLRSSVVVLVGRDDALNMLPTETGNGPI